MYFVLQKLALQQFMYTISEINIYPVKSLSGISLQSAEVEECGLKYDRRWVLVDETNTFFTQRDFPEMALIKVVIEKDGLYIQHKQKSIDPLKVPFDFEHSTKEQIVIWDDTVVGEFYNKTIDGWFSDVLGIKCHLVKMPATTKRFVDKNYAENKIVSFADAFPFLIIGQASLDNLNSRMTKPLPMNRFRTNFVFSGGNPFDEDRWEKIKIGDVVFDVVKPCARCVITTVNQDTSVKGNEPLSTLATFRNVNGKVLFGQNMVAEKGGKFDITSKIEVLKWK